MATRLCWIRFSENEFKSSWCHRIKWKPLLGPSFKRALTVSKTSFYPMIMHHQSTYARCINQTTRFIFIGPFDSIISYGLVLLLLFFWKKNSKCKGQFIRHRRQQLKWISSTPTHASEDEKEEEEEMNNKMCSIAVMSVITDFLNHHSLTHSLIMRMWFIVTINSSFFSHFFSFVAFIAWQTVTHTVAYVECRTETDTDNVCVL